MVVEINLTPTATPFEIAAGQHSITGRTWGNLSECTAAALLVHGLGAHSGWFEAFGRRLKVHRVFAVAYDQIGFGKRRAEPFHSYLQWLEDVKRVYLHVQEQVGRRPIYLMGNSGGAVIALCAAPLVKPTGLTLFSPGFDGCPSTFPLRFKAWTLVKALLFPDRETPLPYSTDLITGDEGVRRWTAGDPDRRSALTGRMWLELLLMSRRAGLICKEIMAPVLMLTAGCDQIVSNATNSAVFENLVNSHRRRVHLPEAWHDIMFDPLIDEVVREVMDWMSECLPETALAGQGDLR